MRKLNVEVGLISPATYHFSDLKNHSAYCCISLSNPNFYGKKLGAIFDFLNKNFNHVMIITSGHLYRHNYKITHNCTQDEALKLSLEEENHYIAHELNPYMEIISNQKFQVTSWTEHFFSTEFQNSTEEVLNFYNHNFEFENGIKDVALNFLKHSKFLSKKSNNNLVTEDNLKSSIDFLLEETAFFNYIIQKGFRVEIYPGSMMQVLNDIANNRFQNAPEGLTKRITVPLKLKRVGRSLKQANHGSNALVSLPN